MFLDDIRMIPSHTAGTARLRVAWHTPDRSARNAPVARNPSVVSTCVGTDHPWLLAVLRSRAAALRTTPATLASVNEIGSGANCRRLQVNPRVP